MIGVAILFACISLAATAPTKEEVPLLESNHVRDDHGIILNILNLIV